MLNTQGVTVYAGPVMSLLGGTHQETIPAHFSSGIYLLLLSTLTHKKSKLVYIRQMGRGQIFIVFIALLISACVKDKAQEVKPPLPCENEDVTWDIDVKPLLVRECSGSTCHIATLTPGGGLLYEEYGKTKEEALSPGSCFLSSIQQDSTCALMPSGLGKLMESDIRLIECWIFNGAPK